MTVRHIYHNKTASLLCSLTIVPGAYWRNSAIVGVRVIITWNKVDNENVIIVVSINGQFRNKFVAARNPKTNGGEPFWGDSL